MKLTSKQIKYASSALAGVVLLVASLFLGGCCSSSTDESAGCQVFKTVLSTCTAILSSETSSDASTVN